MPRAGWHANVKAAVVAAHDYVGSSGDDIVPKVGIGLRHELHGCLGHRSARAGFDDFAPHQDAARQLYFDFLLQSGLGPFDELAQRQIRRAVRSIRRCIEVVPWKWIDPESPVSVGLPVNPCPSALL